MTGRHFADAAESDAEHDRRSETAVRQVEAVLRSTTTADLPEPERPTVPANP